MTQRNSGETPGTPTRKKAGWFLDRAFVAEADFDRFCLENFPAIRQRFTAGMDRVARTTVLLERADAAAVLGQVSQDAPETYAKLEQQWIDATTPKSKLGLRLGNFELRAPIGRGANATIYEAIHVQNEQLRAIKVWAWHLAQDPGLRWRFDQEVRRITKIRSKHVVEIIDSGVDADGCPYLVMERLEGQTLASYLNVHQSLPAEEVLALCCQLADALSAAHQIGIVHGDIQPENLFLCTSIETNETKNSARFLKVLAFGVSGLEDCARNETSEWVRPSRIWAAPELSQGRVELTPAADVWAFGLLVFRMLVGHHYFRCGENSAPSAVVDREIQLDPLSVASIRAQSLGKAEPLPPSFDEWFFRCVNRDPMHRFQSVDDALQSLSLALRKPTSVVVQTTVGSTADMPESSALLHPLPPTTLQPSMRWLDELNHLATQRWVRTMAFIISFVLSCVLCVYMYYLSKSMTDRCLHWLTPKKSQVIYCYDACRYAESQQATAGRLKSIINSCWIAVESSSNIHDLSIMLNRLCEFGDHRGCKKMIDHGLDHRISTNLVQALTVFRKSCSLGTSEGCELERKFLDDIDNFPVLPSQAEDLFSLACKGGEHQQSCWQQIKILRKRKLAEQQTKAKALSLIMCNKGHLLACNVLGEMYRDGAGAERSFEEAGRFFKLACDGDLQSGGCTNLGKLYRDGLIGVQDYAQARSLFTKSCEASDWAGCTNLGKMYLTGLGLDPTPLKAFDYFKKACDERNMEGCFELGLMYDQGKFVARNVSLAEEYLKKACSEDGNIVLEACDRLGLLYRSKRDMYLDAMEIFKKACDDDYLPSCVNLGELSSARESLKYFQKACEGKFIKGCTKIGIANRDGNGIKKADYAEARERFRFVCNHDCAPGDAVCDTEQLNGCNLLLDLFTNGQFVDTRSEVRAGLEKGCKKHPEGAACKRLKEPDLAIRVKTDE